MGLFGLLLEPVFCCWVNPKRPLLLAAATARRGFKGDSIPPPPPRDPPPLLGVPCPVAGTGEAAPEMGRPDVGSPPVPVTLLRIPGRLMPGVMPFVLGLSRCSTNASDSSPRRSFSWRNCTDRKCVNRSCHLMSSPRPSLLRLL